MTSVSDASQVDGRRARRERGRAAVVEAVFTLLEDGQFPPTGEAIARESGVSMASVFRYFESLDDLLRHAIERHFERYAEAFDLPDVGVGSLEERIRHLVDARLDLFEVIAPVARVARHQALVHEIVATSLHSRRELMILQLRAQFAPELAPLGAAAADDLIGLLHVLTSFESWELLTSTHDRTRLQVRRAWIAGLTRLLA